MTATAIRLKESPLRAETAVLDHTLPAGEPYLLVIERGQILRIVDVEGNQAVDVIFYNGKEDGNVGPSTYYGEFSPRLSFGKIFDKDLCFWTK